MATRFLTEAELRLEYGDTAITKLADRNGDGSADAGVIEGAILDAEDEALSHLRSQRYLDPEIPSEPTTASRRLKVLTSAIAYYNLFKTRAETPIRVWKGYELAVAAFKSIGKNELSALLPNEPVVDRARPIIVASRRTSSDDEKISLKSMRYWGHRT